MYLVKEPAEARYDTDIRKNLYANVELHKIWYVCVVLTCGTASPDGLPEYLGDQLTGAPRVNAKGSGMMKGPANLDEAQHVGERVGV